MLDLYSGLMHTYWICGFLMSQITFSEEEETEIDTKSKATPEESSTKNFVESAEFGFLRQRFNIPVRMLVYVLSLRLKLDSQKRSIKNFSIF